MIKAIEPLGKQSADQIPTHRFAVNNRNSNSGVSRRELCFFALKSIARAA